MTPEQYQQLVAKIVEANPEIMNAFQPEGMTVHDYQGVPVHHRPIRLADVLLAALKAEPRYGLACGATGVLFGEYRGHIFAQDGSTWYSTAPTWNLRSDDLNSQSDETKEFLFSLLCS